MSWRSTLWPEGFQEIKAVESSMGINHNLCVLLLGEFRRSGEECGSGASLGLRVPLLRRTLLRCLHLLLWQVGVMGLSGFRDLERNNVRCFDLVGDLPSRACAIRRIQSFETCLLAVPGTHRYPSLIKGGVGVRSGGKYLATIITFNFLYIILDLGPERKGRPAPIRSPPLTSLRTVSEVLKLELVLAG